MPHACISVVGGDGNQQNEFVALTMPLARIAKKLGVQGIADGKQLPPGYWVCDGAAGSEAYNWFELVEKMTGKIFGNYVPCSCKFSKYIINGKMQIIVDPSCPKHGDQR